ncbi:MAG TPA: ArsR family transcriptional regulator [Thermoplasmata archaeon]|nr:ArsR family transcriptional regulator [Thermoplasmata archaeon]
MAKPVPARKLSRVVDALVLAGIPKNVAKSLVCVASKGEITSAGIEGATGLRQPEVSIAVQELRQLGWVAKRDIKKVGKGRPIHSYRLAAPLKEILRGVEEAEHEKMNRIESNLKVLRELLELE